MAACCAGDASGVGETMAFHSVSRFSCTAGYRKHRMDRLSIKAGPALAARNISSAVTSTLADIAGLFFLTHDPRYLGRGEAAEISSNKCAIATVVLQHDQQAIAESFEYACVTG
jgi:hypothetical protein